jgi:cytochrome P450
MIYDPYSREMQHDPFPTYKWFRDHQPCSYNREMDFYALFRFEDVWNATLDWQTMSSSLGPTLENRGQVPGELMSIIGMDPPRHTRLRNLVSRGFTPRRIRALEKEVREIAVHYFDRLRGQSHFDMQQEFAVKLPMDVISALVGIPDSDRDMYRNWVDKGLQRDPESGEIPAENFVDMGRAREYILDLLRQRRANPRDDLISVLAGVEYDEPNGERRHLSDPEVASFITLLAAAGAETTAKLIGNAVVYLWQRPDQRRYVFEDLQRIPNAIEEILRFDAPSQFQGRVALRESTWHGVTIPVDARVALVTGAANRDEREYANPDTLDVKRIPNRELYFGHGQHVCIGKSLARAEARIALEEIALRFPNYEVEESGLTRTYQAHVRGFANVPVRV